MSLVQIQGGSFQSFEGDPLANGYLVVELSHDEQDTGPTPPTQVVAGLRQTILLDTNGGIPSSPAVKVHANSTLNPANSFYSVMAFKQNGTQAWRAPQYWTIPNTDPYDVGNIVPNNPPVNAGAPVGSLLLQTNEVNNGSQALLDLHAGTNITLADNGSGRVTITGASSGLTGSYMIGPGINTPDGYVSQAIANSSITGVNNQLVVTAFDFAGTLTINHVSYVGSNPFGTAHIYIGLYNASGNKILDSGAFTVDNTTATTIQRNAISTVTLTPGTYYIAQTSDDNNTKSNVMQSGVSNTAAALFNANGSVVRYGTAANVLSGGVLPATLGALTAFSTVAILIALPLFD